MRPARRPDSRRRRAGIASAVLMVCCGLAAAAPLTRRTTTGDDRPVPRPPVVLAWFGATAAATLPPLIAPSCPGNPLLDLPGVLCEDFDTERNGVAGFQWSRLPIGALPGDPPAPVGDPNDDVLGFTVGTGPAPAGTGAATCANDAKRGYATCVRVAEENDWHLHSPTEGPGAGYTPPGQPVIGAPDGGKAHRGTRSMHMGRHLTPLYTLGDTIRFRQVSAFVLDSQGDPNLPGLAIGTASTLEFWHIISVPDDENFGGGFLAVGGSFGGGQVQISVLGPDGKFEAWCRLMPSFNGYDSFDQGSLSLCGFDPGDDQLPPTDETMCFPAPLFADKGDVFGMDPSCTVDTDGNDPAHKDCGDVSCAPGSGCTENGSVGPGVWTRSAFDLSPFAGRLARLRWIGMVEGGWSFGTSRSALEPAYGGIAYQYFDGDDGWWIDDIALTDLRVSPLPCGGDADGDGFLFCMDDCDDAHASVHPGAPEVCDGLNNDCNDPNWPAAGPVEFDNDGDGLATCQGDCNDGEASVYPGAPQICDGLNNDCNDPNWPVVDPNEADADSDGVLVCQGDCDDTHGSVRPGAPQICDGLNNDCNDPNWPSLAGTNEIDDDADSFSQCGGDCDDTRPTVYPGAPQICGDGLNNDCAAAGWPSLTGTNEFDDDGDTLSECAGDCDDTHATVYPGAPQICDGLDNDCSDPSWPALPPGEGDTDLDGSPDCADCDDTHATVYPGAPQICGDGLNNDCNATGWPSLAGTNEVDDDGDTLSECAGDCDDTHATVYPGAAQICDGFNNDCNAPEWPSLAGTNEGDGDGDLISPCGGDCDDTRASVYPGAPEICDRLNNDCNDPGWPTPPPSDTDGDQDLFAPCQGDCDDTRASVYLGAPQICGDGLNNDCSAPGWPSLAGTNENDDDGDTLSECAGDCDDTRATVYPGAPQICDGLNNDCNDPLWPAPLSTDLDVDGDGHYTCASAVPADCNDGNPTVWSAPGEVTGLRVSLISIGWHAPADRGGTGSVHFDALRTDETADFASPAVCLLTDVFDLETGDPELPAPGHAFLYVARARNICPAPFNLGTIGSATDGTPRPARTCP